MFQCKKCDFKAAQPLELAHHTKKAHPKRKRRAAPPPAPEVDGEITLASDALVLFNAAELDDAARVRVADWLGSRFREVA